MESLGIGDSWNRVGAGLGGCGLSFEIQSLELDFGLRVWDLGLAVEDLVFLQLFCCSFLWRGGLGLQNKKNSVYGGP